MSGNHACTTPAESAGDGNELYGYVCCLPICTYGIHTSGTGARGAGFFFVEATKIRSIIADGRATNIAIPPGVVQAWLPYTCCFRKCSSSMVATHTLAVSASALPAWRPYTRCSSKWSVSQVSVHLAFRQMSCQPGDRTLAV